MRAIRLGFGRRPALDHTCAPSPIRRSDARNSPWIRPKTCAGPSHSMLPTIDMSEPMQEAAPDFVIALHAAAPPLS